MTLGDRVYTALTGRAVDPDERDMLVVQVRGLDPKLGDELRRWLGVAPVDAWTANIFRAAVSGIEIRERREEAR